MVRGQFESLGSSFIAFVRNGQIWTANADGSEQKQLTEGWDGAPAVSPDGKTIVYTRFNSEEKSPESGEPNPEAGLGSMKRTTWTPSYAAIYAVPHLMKEDLGAAADRASDTFKTALDTDEDKGQEN